jgi:hypothetical protein
MVRMRTLLPLALVAVTALLYWRQHAELLRLSGEREAMEAGQAKEAAALEAQIKAENRTLAGLRADSMRPKATNVQSVVDELRKYDPDYSANTQRQMKRAIAASIWAAISELKLSPDDATGAP